MRYFLKHVFSTKVFDLKGKAIPFIEHAENTGLLETGDALLIEALEKLIENEQGGVQEVSQDEFLAQKKTLESKPLRSLLLLEKQRQHLVPVRRDELFKGRKGGADAAAIANGESSNGVLEVPAPVVSTSSRLQKAIEQKAATEPAKMFMPKVSQAPPLKPPA